LLVGGYVSAGQCCFQPTNACEIYDPATNAWTATGSLNVARELHQAVLLADGRVLVAGGRDLTGLQTKTSELYDPASGSWSFTKALQNEPGGNLVLLTDGRVLAAGGGLLATNCQLYDPGTGTWSITASLNVGRSGFQATRLNDGRVLIVGGLSPIMPKFVRQTELYDPVTGTWSLSGMLNRARYLHVQVLLADGRVEIAGGRVEIPSSITVTRIAEIFDPNTGIWTLTHPLTTPRVDFTANLLSDGNVFAAGGTSGDIGEPLASIEEFEAATGRWHLLTTTLATARQLHTATTLLEGSVLIAGGFENREARPVANAEIFVNPH
jgi:hypothetical protein